MKRRQFIQLALASMVLGPARLEAAPPQIRLKRKWKTVYNPPRYIQEKVHANPFYDPPTYIPGQVPVKSIALDEDNIRDYLTKIRNPDRPHRDDIVLEPSEFELLKSVVTRMARAQRIIGHGHFCVVGFDRVRRIANSFSKVGPFTRAELEFIEKIYYKDAELYGFKGQKQVMQLTGRINRKHIKKVPYTGNYLYRGQSLQRYEQMRSEIGDQMILTSGIRSVVKQFYLFVRKTFRHGGNLSLASRSLAPPGYSYYATGDFDVGQKGFGAKNFSNQFTHTPVFSRLTNLGYVKHRYQRDNLLGVRYEPWHIKL